jgi:hypothetical protein
MSTSKVAVLRVSPGSILEDIDRLCDLAGVEQALAPSVPTILKDNISWHFPFPGANTTPWQLEGTIRALAARGYDDLVCVQNKTVVTDAFKGEDLNGYVPVFQKYGVPVRYNFKPEEMSWSFYKPTARMNVLDEIYPEGILIPDDFHGANIIHLPTVKCHIYTTTTGAMKNAFGGLLNTKRHYTHSWIHATLVDLLAILDPMSIDYIRIAHEQGLGKGKRDEIEVVGDTHLADERWGFSVGDNGASMVGDMMWFGPLKRFQKLFFHTPLVKLFVFGSEVYHDYYRWPMRDRRVFEAWKAETHWGRLFDTYRTSGTLADAAAGSTTAQSA